MIVSIILENKATNLIPVMVLKVAFDFCFRRVTKEGYMRGADTSAGMLILSLINRPFAEFPGEVSYSNQTIHTTQVKASFHPVIGTTTFSRKLPISSLLTSELQEVRSHFLEFAYYLR